MKRFNLLQVVVMAVLVVVAVSCTTTRGGYDDYVDMDDPNGRSYQSNTPLRNGPVILVERDPFTGRYYQVSPYGSNAGIYPVDNYRYYNNRNYNNRNYNNNRRYNNNNYNRGYRSEAQQPRVIEEQRPQSRENLDKAKETILGKKRTD